ncbi:hypothetical protein D9757_006596 [Collybiopsis confluens]|uniref:F-box domain-containing protein n=1 Tax=Collybiopsis confluens TaxID=2823264 RepID=A0A8H5MB84_9AGAR|nr:hypothetical protein D9757_006596 [Collybiopsis confluens]
MDPVLQTSTQSWIREAPNEILAEIFQWATTLSSSLSSCSTNERKGPGVPEILSQVCVHWRQLAYSTPALWTGLELRASCTANPNGKKLLSQWFSRSRAVDVTLSISPHSQGPELQNMMQILCANSHLWRKLHLHVPWYSVMIFFGMGVLRTPMLEELAIEVRSDPLAGIYPNYLPIGAGRTILTDAQQLRTVHLALLPTFSLDLLHDFLPWSNLTDITFQKPGVHPALVTHIFTHCKRLVRLKLWTAYWRMLGFSMEYSDEYCLENLESLELEAEILPLSHLLRSVRLPALKSLSLTNIADPTEEQYPVEPPLAIALMDLQEHSQFNLTQLKMCDLLELGHPNHLCSDDIIQFIGEIPGIKSLELESHGRPVEDSWGSSTD